MQNSSSSLSSFGRARSAPRRRAAGISLLGALLFGAAVLASGCHGGASCYDTYDCDCHGRRECILGCSRDGCDLACSHTRESCGAICEDDCRFDCHDTNHCSAVCGADCDYRCRNVESCAGECGARCNYVCHDMTHCAARVGPDSTVECRSVASCEVICDGPCSVTCDPSRCDVGCAPGLTRRSRPGGFVCE